jgi:hypothetical protein
MYYLDTLVVQGGWGDLVFDPPDSVSYPPGWDPLGAWYKKNTTVTLDTVDKAGYQFQRWSGAHVVGSIYEVPKSIEMTGPKGIAAHFGQEAQITVGTIPDTCQYSVIGEYRHGVPTINVSQIDETILTLIVDSTYSMSVITPQQVNTPGGETRYAFKEWT